MFENIKIFGRTKPNGKKHIVAKLQSYGHTVGMTGDGGNDTGALRQADIGLALIDYIDGEEKAECVVDEDAAGNNFAPQSALLQSNPEGGDSGRKTTHEELRLQNKAAANDDKDKHSGGSGSGSIVAPFVSQGKKVYAVVQLIREGRCCLDSSVNVFLWFIIFGLVWVSTTKIYVMTRDAFMQMAAWIYCDGVQQSFTPWGMTRVGPNRYKTVHIVGKNPKTGVEMKEATFLTPRRPDCEVFGAPFLFKKLLPATVVCLLTVFTFFILLINSDWFPGLGFGLWYRKVEFSRDAIETSADVHGRSHGYDPSLIYLNQCLTAVITAIILSLGNSYKDSIFRNWSFMVVITLILVPILWPITVGMEPNYWNCLIHVNCNEETYSKLWGKFSILRRISF